MSIKGWIYSHTRYNKTSIYFQTRQRAPQETAEIYYGSDNIQRVSKMRDKEHMTNGWPPRKVDETWLGRKVRRLKKRLVQDNTDMPTPRAQELRLDIPLASPAFLPVTVKFGAC
jgi:hypothetical protein